MALSPKRKRKSGDECDNDITPTKKSSKTSDLVELLKFSKGDRIEALKNDGTDIIAFHPGTISAVNESTFDITYDNRDTEQGVLPVNLRPCTIVVEDEHDSAPDVGIVLTAAANVVADELPLPKPRQGDDKVESHVSAKARGHPKKDKGKNGGKGPNAGHKSNQPNKTATDPVAVTPLPGMSRQAAGDEDASAVDDGVHTRSGATVKGPETTTSTATSSLPSSASCSTEAVFSPSTAPQNKSRFSTILSSAFLAMILTIMYHTLQQPPPNLPLLFDKIILTQILMKKAPDVRSAILPIPVTIWADDDNDKKLEKDLIALQEEVSKIAVMRENLEQQQEKVTSMSHSAQEKESATNTVDMQSINQQLVTLESDVLESVERHAALTAQLEGLAEGKGEGGDFEIKPEIEELKRLEELDPSLVGAMTAEADDYQHSIRTALDQASQELEDALREMDASRMDADVDRGTDQSSAAGSDSVEEADPSTLPVLLEQVDSDLSEIADELLSIINSMDEDRSSLLDNREGDGEGNGFQADTAKGVTGSRSDSDSSIPDPLLADEAVYAPLTSLDDIATIASKLAEDLGHLTESLGDEDGQESEGAENLREGGVLPNSWIDYAVSPRGGKVVTAVTAGDHSVLSTPTFKPSNGKAKMIGSALLASLKLKKAEEASDPFALAESNPQSILSYLPPRYGNVYALQGNGEMGLNPVVTVLLYSHVFVKMVCLVHVFPASIMDVHAPYRPTYIENRTRPPNSEENMQASAVHQFVLTGWAVDPTHHTKDSTGVKFNLGIYRFNPFESLDRSKAAEPTHQDGQLALPTYPDEEVELQKDFIIPDHDVITGDKIPSLRAITIQVLSNHGNKILTSIYRIKIKGLLA